MAIKRLLLFAEQKKYMVNQSTEKQYLQDLIECYDVKVTTDKPTRVFTNVKSQTTTSQIDYILANSSLHVLVDDTVETHFSDHKAIFLECFLGGCPDEHLEPKKKQYVYRDISLGNLDRLLNSMSEVNFSDVYKCTNVDDGFHCFMKVIQDLIDQCCPKKAIKVHEKSKALWITSEVKG
ncbi:hypothetical protein WA026_017709 [Henosepilachna vigintioctopunctata]|uniref:Uncharacterized protein n=1 Tax=Henosepilachna vigintioctopunctata TaxID=420089 RepID=A0AAW1U4A4_9CUCU